MSLLPWVKSFHIIFVITWFAGLFYLPRLFVYHAMSEDRPSIERFKTMERKLLVGIMTPSVVLVIATGLWLFLQYSTIPVWLYIKVLLVVVLVAYHIWCWKLVKDFKEDRNTHSHVWYRWFNEFPVLLLVAIVILVEVKPF